MMLIIDLSSFEHDQIKNHYNTYKCDKNMRLYLVVWFFRFRFWEFANRSCSL